MDHTVNIFYVWLVLLNIMPERFIPIGACSRVCSFLCCIILHYVSLPQCIPSHTVDGHEVSFQLKVITNNARMNIFLICPFC